MINTRIERIISRVETLEMMARVNIIIGAVSGKYERKTLNGVSALPELIADMVTMKVKTIMIWTGMTAELSSSILETVEAKAP